MPASGIKRNRIRLFINVPPVTNIMQMDSAFGCIELVKHTISTNSQFEFRPSGESLVRKASQAKTHVIYFAFDGFTNRNRQRIECLAESRRPDL
jgi:hypothetical protein